MSFLQSFFKKIIPTVNASDDDELEDPQKMLREKCGAKPKCRSLKEELETCNKRVLSRKQTEETCLQEIIDYVECVDHCAAETLFSYLK